jgi:hypothetical protein
MKGPQKNPQTLKIRMQGNRGSTHRGSMRGPPWAHKEYMRGPVRSSYESIEGSRGVHKGSMRGPRGVHEAFTMVHRGTLMV